MNFKIIIFFLTLFIWSCEKEEIAILPHTSGDEITNIIDNPIYANQFYFDLETNQFVSNNQKVAWDLGFGCGEHGNTIYTNAAKSMSAAKIENGNFADITSAANLEFKYDSSNGHHDSTAINDLNNHCLYIIDLGYNETGIHQGYGKT